MAERFIVWSTYLLWVICIFDMIWALVLFLTVGDLLTLTGTDLVNFLVLLSSVIILPQNIYLLRSISNDVPVDPNSLFGLCSLRMYMSTVIVLNGIGAIWCIQRLFVLHTIVTHTITQHIRSYRNLPGSKEIVDKVQVLLGCCGINSFKDWFKYNWNTKDDYAFEIEDNGPAESDEYELPLKKSIATYKDNVPFSCCKSGVCVANYLDELGVGLINHHGCVPLLRHVVNISMISHLIMFLTVMTIEVLLLNDIIDEAVKRDKITQDLYDHQRRLSLVSEEEYMQEEEEEEEENQEMINNMIPS